MKSTIICVTDSHKHFGAAIEEYLKRVGGYVTLKTIKPVKRGSRDEIIQKETDAICHELSGRDEYIVLLSKEGKNYSTQQWYEFVVCHSHIVYVIGGPYGVDESRLREHAHGFLSLGKQTMPHGLALLVVLEQLYRLRTISVGKSYHY